MKRVCFALFALLPIALLVLAPSGQSNVQPIKKVALRKIDDHVKHLHEAKFDQYKGRPGVKVINETEFNKMKAHLLSLCQNVKAEHTFIGHGGHHIDCIPIDQQPGARAELKRGNKVQYTPPDLQAKPKAGEKKLAANTQGIPPQLAKGMKDAHGHEMHCRQGCIPMKRITLADMTRFRTLKDFFQKHHVGSKHPPRHTKVQRPESGAVTHRYAHAYQTVKNHGGSSWLNLWDPTPLKHQFSLSQQWFTGGSPVQTIEGGWQVYPDLYGHSKPVLFIYWTADGYNNTGAYNLSKPGFIQVNNSFVLGGAWSNWSKTSGAQYGFRMTWYRDPANGNWWLYIKGAGDQIAIGYYPKSLFGSGQLSKYATEIDYGGEVTGEPASGEMGSGAFANKGWQQAAFQKEVYYFPTASSSAWANLTPSMTNKTYYTIDVHNKTATNWGTYFYFGGPGGK